MIKFSLILLCGALHSIKGSTFEPSDLPFPADFQFGVATASYQIEGAWNEHGKGPNVWDVYLHEHSDVLPDNGDIACDSYHKYLEDVDNLKNLGVDHYRFSLSWARILPNGSSSVVNLRGLDYYKRLLSALREKGIEPVVTLYHWDLPQALKDIGGWVNPDIVEYFADYAALAFENFGMDVPYWVTFNEPKQTCHGGYGNGRNQPGVEPDGKAEYLCTHNLLKAHARAYHIYEDNYKKNQKGQVSIVIDSSWFEPETDDPEDVEAAERIQQFNLGWFANPIYSSEGNYPQIMIDRVAERSKAEGFNQSRLPEFTQEEIEYIRGTFDYFALNHYSTLYANRQPDANALSPSWSKDCDINTFADPTWQQSVYANVVPWGFRKLLGWIDRTYDHPRILVTENGFPAFNDSLADNDRINYFTGYLSNLLQAIHEDGVDVFGYTAWSLMDNLEWSYGYSVKFGLYQVDFDSPNRTRTIKRSGEFFKGVLERRCLVEKCVEQ